MLRISFSEMKDTIFKAFVKAGMPANKAEICARVHTESSCDGVYSHGLNRVERFVDYIHKGWVDVHAEPVKINDFGAIRVYDGNLAPGILNAFFAVDRAAELAEIHGIGLVSLKNTTHWMRGGSYGWYAAEKGYAAICWTNTESCMPAWGSKSENIGNNPFIMALPHPENHMVLDMAMSQYSYGKLQVKRLNNEKLPFAGGFDADGKLTDNPGIIESTRRILPTGFWKGSGLAIMLDIFSAFLSNGLSTAGIDKAGLGSCGACNQVFILFKVDKFTASDNFKKLMDETILQIKTSVPAEDADEIYFPGEQSLIKRKTNMALGIPVDISVWEKVKKLAE